MLRIRGDRSKQSKRYRYKHAIKNRAHQTLYMAIKKGRIIKPNKCEICGMETENKSRIMGHHKDYTKRLDVIWLCWKCHEGEHAKRRINGVGRKDKS